MQHWLVFAVLATSVYGFSIQKAEKQRKQQVPCEILDHVSRNYTIQDSINTSYPVYHITYSPDDYWIVYNRQGSDQNMTIYFRNRSSLKDESWVSIGNPHTERIKTYAFSKKGDFLFVGAYSQYLYICKFSSKMTSTDCTTKFDLGEDTVINAIEVNSVNRLVVNSVATVWIVNFNGLDNITLETKFTLEKTIGVTAKWHPKAANQIVIIGGFNDTGSNGFFIFYNVSSKNSSIFQNTPIYSFDVFPDGELLVASTFSYVRVFNITETTIEPTVYVLDKIYDKIKICLDGTLMIAHERFGSNTHLEVYYLGRYPLVERHSNAEHFLMRQKLESEKSDLSEDNVTFTPICSMESNDTNLYTSTSDGNEILIREKDNNELVRYSLCLNRTFYSNFQCLNCSSNCSTCHITQNTCLSCPSNLYAVSEQGVCLPCGKFIAGCQSCVSSSYCLACDSLSGFMKNPVSGLCVCNDFYYIAENKTCTLCDGKNICKRCASPTECQSCNTANKWQQAPTNGTCVCQDPYWNSQGTCLLCDSYGICKQCFNSSICLKCDSNKAFNQTPSNGQCVCQNSFSYDSDTAKCIECKVTGCALCKAKNVCSSCSSADDELSNGSCVQSSNLTGLILGCSGGAIVFILVGIFVYCKWKKGMKTQDDVDTLISQEKQKQPEKTIKAQNKFDHEIIVSDTGDQTLIVSKAGSQKVESKKIQSKKQQPQPKKQDSTKIIQKKQEPKKVESPKIQPEKVEPQKIGASKFQSQKMQQRKTQAKEQEATQQPKIQQKVPAPIKKSKLEQKKDKSVIKKLQEKPVHNKEIEQKEQIKEISDEEEDQDDDNEPSFIRQYKRLNKNSAVRDIKNEKKKEKEKEKEKKKEKEKEKEREKEKEKEKQKEKEKDGDEPSFIRQYQRLMEKSVVQDKKKEKRKGKEEEKKKEKLKGKKELPVINDIDYVMLPDEEKMRLGLLRGSFGD